MTARRTLLVRLAVLATGGVAALACLLGTPQPSLANATTATATATATAAAAGRLGSATTATAKDCAKGGFTTSSPEGGTTYGSYYVTNNMWNALSVKQTLHACSHDRWHVDSTMTNQAGAVQTYPNAQMTFSKPPKLGTIKSLRSSFAESTTPSGRGDDYEYAYDIWINGYGGKRTSELMIWNYNHGRTPGGTPKGTFAEGRHTYRVYVSGTASAGDYVAFVATSNSTSGTVDLVDFFHYAISKRWIEGGASAKLWQVDYGVEISSTGGHPATFGFTKFDVVPVYAASEVTGIRRGGRPAR